jgi:hypothetical protein
MFHFDSVQAQDALLRYCSKEFASSEWELTTPSKQGILPAA